MNSHRPARKTLQSRKQTLSGEYYDTLFRVCVRVCQLLWPHENYHENTSFPHMFEACWTVVEKSVKKCKMHHQGSRMNIDSNNKLTTERRVGQVWKHSLTKLQLTALSRIVFSTESWLRTVNRIHNCGLLNWSGRERQGELRLFNENSKIFLQASPTKTFFIVTLTEFVISGAAVLVKQFCWLNWPKELHFLLLLPTQLSPKRVHNSFPTLKLFPLICNAKESILNSINLSWVHSLALV